MNRNNCVLCENESMKIIYSLPQYPLLRHSIECFSKDKYSDLVFVKCSICGCVQLFNLQDPDFLYKENNNQTFLTSTWYTHNEEFAEFILSNGSVNSIVEMGGLTGHLARAILKKQSMKYTILDICDKFPDISGIEFIHANIEQYDFPDSDSIVMSHVFEHLYEPRKFLKTLHEKQVKNIFISIPHMKSLLEKSIPLLINVEHTFYLNSYLCKELFQSMGYQCVKEKTFRDHSLFFHFKYDSPREISWNSFMSDEKDLDQYFNSYSIQDLSQTLPEEFYIAPGGYYGQFLYYQLKNKKNVKGFLDNDKQKEGWRVYGTPHTIIHPTSLQNRNPITICLASSVYSSEIIQSFKNVLASCSIVFVESGSK